MERRLDRLDMGLASHVTEGRQHIQIPLARNNRSDGFHPRHTRNVRHNMMQLEVLRVE